MSRLLKRVLCSPSVIVVAAFLLRMAVVYTYHRASPIPVRNAPFGYELGRVARALAAGEGFSSPLRIDTGPTAWFTPLYPLLIAGIFRMFGIYSYVSYLVIQSMNAAFAALTCIPIFYMGRRTFGSLVGASAAWAWVFMPAAIFFPLTWVWDTSLSALWMALIFWATLEMPERRNMRAWLGYGALWTCGILTNPALLSLLPFLLLWAGWRARKRGAPWIRQMAAVAIVFLVGITPWTIRNYRVFHRFIPLRSNFGLELWLGNNPAVPGTWSWWLHPNDDPPEAEKYRNMGEIAYMEMKQREAVEFMKTHPAEVAGFAFRRFVENWLGMTDSVADAWQKAPWYARSIIAVNCLMTLSCLFGGLFAYRTRSPEAAPYALVLLIFPLVFYVTHSSLRYRFPIDPIITVLAAYGIAYPIALLARRFSAMRTAALASDAAQ